MLYFIPKIYVTNEKAFQRVRCVFLKKKIRPLVHVIPRGVPKVWPLMGPLPKFLLRIPLWYGRWRICRKLQYCADTYAPIPWDSGTAHSPGADILCTNCNLSANSIWSREHELLKIDTCTTCTKPITTITNGLLARDMQVNTSNSRSIISRIILHLLSCRDDIQIYMNNFTLGSRITNKLSSNVVENQTWIASAYTT